MQDMASSKVEGLEVAGYEGEGYMPLVSFGQWRVAVLRRNDDLNPARIHSMERHLETDEVFILTRGKAMLALGGTCSEISDISYYAMHNGEACNVKAGAWHTIIVSRDAHLIIVENDNTTTENSEYSQVPEPSQEALRCEAFQFLGEGG